MADDPLPTAFQARITFPPFPEITPVYATNMVVQHTGQEYILSFFAIHPPVDLESSGMAQRYETVPAQCVARVVISLDRMPAFVEVLSAHVAQSQNAMAALAAAKEKAKDGV